MANEEVLARHWHLGTTAMLISVALQVKICKICKIFSPGNHRNAHLSGAAGMQAKYANYWHIEARDIFKGGTVGKKITLYHQKKFVKNA